MRPVVMPPFSSTRALGPEAQVFSRQIVLVGMGGYA